MRGRITSSADGGVSGCLIDSRDAARRDRREADFLVALVRARMSVVGTFRKFRDVRYLVAIGGIADIVTAMRTQRTRVCQRRSPSQ